MGEPPPACKTLKFYKQRHSPKKHQDVQTVVCESRD